MITNHDCTVIVCSCDKYADLLAPFSALWKKFWPDCPFELILITESAPSSTSNLQPSTSNLSFDRIIACGPGGNWCSRLVLALGQITTPYVLMLCDDYYLEKPVDTKLMLKRLEQIQKFNADNLRLIPNPKPAKNNSTAFGHETDLFQYRPATAYSVATQTGFWRKDFLRELATGKNSIWEFERYGSFDPLAAKNPLLVTPTKEFPFLDAVHKGHWETWGLKVCRDNGIDLSDIRRTLPPLKVRLIEGLKALVFKLLPTDWIVKIQNAHNLGAKEKH